MNTVKGSRKNSCTIRNFSDDFKPLEVALDPNCGELDACDPLSALAAESWDFKKDACLTCIY